MDPYIVLLTVLGVAAVGAAVLPRLLADAPLSLPIVYLGLGMAVFALPLGLEPPDPLADGQAAERLTEFVVIVSLLGAGLKLNRPLGRRAWRSTWRLLAITMPLTIAAVTALGVGPLGLPLAGALLLGAAMAPTDPVLASDVQVEGPAEEDADDEVRFALTSEAGLNDALAFPFTNLAIVLADGDGLAGWVVDDVVVKLAVGLLAGLLCGRAIAWLAFRIPSRSALARTSEGFVALGATLAVYGVTELLHGYGFLAVFVAAVTIRAEERDHDYQQILHDFAETVERLASIVLLVLLGGTLVSGVLGALGPAGIAVAVLTVLAVRPLAGWVGLAGTDVPRRERGAIAFFGIRGMGSLYYLAHALTEERFPGDVERLWAVALLAIVVSIVVHGTTATPWFRHLDRRRARAGEASDARRSASRALVRTRHG